MEPVRLQKYIASSGHCSRRAAEEKIAAGNVKVNGVVVTAMGVKVEPDDVVMVDGMVIKPQTRKVYIALNKPVGYISAMSDDKGRPIVADLVRPELGSGVYPIGRLDYDTHGLLLMTNDGEAAQHIAHPSKKIPKTYVMTLHSPIVPRMLKALFKGCEIDGLYVSADEIEVFGEHRMSMTIHEGRNRQVRRMVEAAGNKVTDLQRISVGIIQLGSIPLGRWRHLTKTEAQYVLGLR